MKNNFLNLSERNETLEIGEIVYTKQDKQTIDEKPHLFSKYGKVETFSNGNQTFIYGIGWCKIKNVQTISNMEEFTYDNLMKMWDTYGENIVFEMFDLRVQDCASQKHIYAFKSFKKNGESDFNKAKKIYDLTLEMNKILVEKYHIKNMNLIEKNMGDFDRRVYYMTNENFLQANSIMLYHYMFGDSNLLSWEKRYNISMDYFELNVNMQNFLKTTFAHKLHNIEGFKIDEYNLGVMPEEFSMKQMFDWIYGDGWGEKVEPLFNPDIKWIVVNNEIVPTKGN